MAIYMGGGKIIDQGSVVRVRDDVYRLGSLYRVSQAGRVFDA